jgi:hypothetical protein
VTHPQDPRQLDIVVAQLHCLLGDHLELVYDLGELAARRRQVRRGCTQTPSPMTSPSIDACAGSQSRGGRSHHKAGGQKPAAPPIFSGGRLGEVRISATRRRPSR